VSERMTSEKRVETKKPVLVRDGPRG
jgi:hypothetical protein